METIDIKSMTSIDEAIHLVLYTAKQKGIRIVADFNGFILDSNNSYDKNLDLYWAYMGRPDRQVNWEQRRYEIAKSVLAAELVVDAVNGIGNTDSNDAVWRSVFYADKLIDELKKKG